MYVDLLCLIGDSTTYDLPRAAKRVLREALDRVEVHPCDRHDDRVRANQLDPAMKELLFALTGYDATRDSGRWGPLDALPYPSAGNGVDLLWQADGNVEAFLSECSQWYQGDWIDEQPRHGFLRRIRTELGFERYELSEEGGFPVVYRLGRRRRTSDDSTCIACAS